MARYCYVIIFLPFRKNDVCELFYLTTPVFLLWLYYSKVHIAKMYGFDAYGAAGSEAQREDFEERKLWD